MRKIHHAIDNIEFGVIDMPATQAFCESAFGWRFNNYGPEYAEIVAADGDGEAGGLDANRAPGTGGPLVQIYSADLDATAAAVTAAGGQIVEGPYDFPGGRGFQFTDPSGNQLAVWTPAGTAQGHTAKPRPLSCLGRADGPATQHPTRRPARLLVVRSPPAVPASLPPGLLLGLCLLRAGTSRVGRE